MNLIDSYRRNAKFVNFEEVEQVILFSWEGVGYRALELNDNVRPQIVIQNANTFYPFSSSEPFEINWHFMLNREQDKISSEFEESLNISYWSNNDIYYNKTLVATYSLENISLPPISKENTEIRLHYRGGCGLRFVIHKRLSRNSLIKQCVGRGVEIGPSFSPQIFASENVRVSYVEPDTAEDLAAIIEEKPEYQHIKELLPLYNYGFADKIPEPDGSLDFIFSSHLFEHLANPIGHLEYWATKLKSKGTIYAIVPDIRGCKDNVFTPCSFSEIISEYKAGSLEPSLYHYERWAKHRRPKGDDPEKYLRERRSIHMHFFTKENLTELLAYSVKQLGFSEYSIIHTPNHKDFYFTITKR